MERRFSLFALAKTKAESVTALGKRTKKTNTEEQRRSADASIQQTNKEDMLARKKFMPKVGKYPANADQGSGAAAYDGVVIPLIPATLKIELIGL